MASAGFEPANLGTKDQHATYRPTKQPQLRVTTDRFLLLSWEGKIMPRPAEGVVWNFSTHFLIVLQTGNPAWLSVLKCLLNISWIAVEVFLFWNKKSLWRTCFGQSTADPYFYSIWCLSESCNALRFMSSPVPPQYYVNQNDKWKVSHSLPSVSTLKNSPFSPQMKNIYGFLRFSESTPIVVPTVLTNGLS